MTDDSDPARLRERAEADPAAPARALEDGADPAAVGDALAALGEDGHDVDDAVAAVTALLEDDDASTRAGAALALGVVFDAHPSAGVADEVTTALAARLEDDYRVARKHAGTALRAVAREQPSAAVAAADRLPGLLDPDRPAHLRIGLDLVDVVVETDPDAAVAVLAPLLDALLGMADAGVEEDPTAGAAGASASPGVRGVPLGAFDERERFARASHSQRNRVAATVREVIVARPEGAAGALEAVLAVLETVDAGAVRAPLAEALGHAARADPEAVLPAIGTLAALLEDDDPGAAGSAAWTLGVLADAASERVAGAAADHVDALAALLDAPQPGTRIASAGLLAYVGEHHPDAAAVATDALVARLDDDASRVRASAALALGHAGATRALAELRERAETDPEEAVRATARAAVERIEAGTGGTGG